MMNFWKYSKLSFLSKWNINKSKSVYKIALIYNSAQRFASIYRHDKELTFTNGKLKIYEGSIKLHRFKALGNIQLNFLFFKFKIIYKKAVMYLDLFLV